MPEWIAAQDLECLMARSLEALELHRDEINALNVFPVPDGDTGTNMYLTVQAVVEEMRQVSGTEMDSMCRAISRGSLMGARGNSGVVLSQILKGVCEVLQEKETAGVSELSEALTRGSEVAYRAVMKPVEGTILTVVREAAEEGRTLARRAGNVEDWLDGVIARARVSLELTPELLPVLKDAGVVDAGGKGLVVFLEGIHAGLIGEEIEKFTFEREARVPAAPAAIVMDKEEGRYEIQFMLRCKDSKVDAFRESLREVGTSVLVVGGEKTYRIHVHTDDLGTIVEEASTLGRLSQVEITDLQEQVEEVSLGRAADNGDKGVGLVAVAVGDGIKNILRDMGVGAIVNGGPEHEPLHGGDAGGHREHPPEGSPGYPQQQEHHPRGGADPRADRQEGRGGAGQGHHRGLRLPGLLRPPGEPGGQPRGHDASLFQHPHRRGDPGGARFQVGRGKDQEG